MFRKDPRVLYVSTHQYPLFPDSGPYDEYSQGGRDRRSILLPLPAGCGDDEFKQVYTEIVAPMVRRFKPELILVSAGYDAHWADEMSHMRLTIDGFHFLVELIDKLAIECYGGGTVYTLEGGYHLSVIRACVNNTFSYWLGESFIEDPLGPPPNAIHAYKFDYVMEQLKRRYGLADGQPGRLIFDSHSGE
jgi:acetoin utilization deacetylase AcuC-like enzyme